MTLMQKLIGLLPRWEDRLIRKQTQIAGQIYDLLNEKDWKQRDLAAASGLKESYVSRVLAGDANLTLESICKIEAAFNADVVTIPLYYVPNAGRNYSGLSKAVESPVRTDYTKAAINSRHTTDQNVAMMIMAQPIEQGYNYATAA